MSAAEGEEQVADSPNVDFTPVVRLPEVETRTLEEDEEELFKIRARLFRYASECSPPEWKERGTGDVRMLKKEGRQVRLVMRRDKTLKICANHYITSRMGLRPNKGSDRAWLYTTLSDFADEESKSETLAIRFANSTNANAFRDAFNMAQEIARQVEPKGESDDDSHDDDSDDDKDKESEEEKENGEVEEKKEETASGNGEEKPAAATEETDKEVAVEAEKKEAATDEVTEKLQELAVTEETSKTEEAKTDDETPAAADAAAPATADGQES